MDAPDRRLCAAYGRTELTAAVDQKQMEALGHLIYVKEYADNTIRGSAAVKHWRIGGE